MFKLDTISLKSKLLLSYLIIFVLIVGVQGGFIYLVIVDQIEESIEKELNNSTNLLNNLVMTSANSSIKNMLRGVAEKNVEILNYYYNKYKNGELSESQAYQEASDILLSQKIGKTGYIYCLNNAGYLKIHPRKQLIDTYVGNNDFVKIQLEKRDGYLEYFWANPEDSIKKPKALYMKYFEPWDLIVSVSSYREEFHELVNVEDFEKSVLDLKFYDTGYSFLLDTLGNMLIHPELKNANLKAAMDKDGKYIIDEMIKQKNGRIYYNWKNPDETEFREKIVIFKSIPEFHWIVASSGYVDEIYKSANSIIYISFLSILMMLSIIGVVSIWIRREFNKPISDLIHKFKEGAEGNFDIRIEKIKPNEIGELSKYFNEFMSKIQTYSDELIKSEANYRLIYENAIEGIFRTTYDGLILGTNSAVPQILGYDSFEDLKMNVKNLRNQLYVNHKDREYFLNELKRNGFIRDFEVQYYKKDNSITWVTINAKAEKDESGNIVYIDGFVTDIDKRKKYEEELANAKKQMTDIIEFLPDPTFVVNANGVVVAWNKAMEEFTGVEKYNIIGKGDYEYSLPFYGSKKEMLIDYFKDRKLERFTEYERIEVVANTIYAENYLPMPNKPNGCYAWGAATIIIDEIGNNYFAIETIRDITQIRKNQEDVKVLNTELERIVLERTEELRETLVKLEKSNRNLVVLNYRLENESEELQRLNEMLLKSENELQIANDTKNKFFSIIAHDLKNPLHGLMIASELLLKYSTKFDVVNIEKTANNIILLSNKLNDLLGNLLSWARNQSGRIDFNPSPVELQVFFNSAYDLFKTRLDEKKINISVDNFIGSIVFADKNLIDTVFRNLISNAVKFTGIEGSIECSAVDSGEYYEVSIKDNGVGLNDEDIEKLFRIDVAQSSIGSSKEKGTGLGLIICKDFIEKHGGTIRVESKLGEGSNFIFTLPKI